MNYSILQQREKTTILFDQCSQQFFKVLNNNYPSPLEVQKFRNEFDPTLQEEIKLVLKQEYTSNDKGVDTIVSSMRKNDGQTPLTFAEAKDNLYYYAHQKLHKLKGSRHTVQREDLWWLGMQL
mgnify:FL=1